MGRLTQRLITTLILSFASAVLFSAASTAAETPAVEAAPDIREVTVYPSMARVTHRGPVSFAKAGPLRLDLLNLSDRLLEESFQVGGKGSAKVRILGSSLERVYFTREVDTKIAELQAEHDALTLERRALNDQREAADQERQFILALKAAYAGEQSNAMARGRLMVEDWRKAGSFVHTRLNALADDTRQIDTQRKALTEKITAIQTELDKLRSKRGRWTTTAHLDLEVVKAGAWKVEAAYLIGGAQWGMVYDARLSKNAKKVELQCFAQVRQHTGQDWNNIALTLSTARPSIGGSIPELDSRYLDFYQPRPPMPVSRSSKRMNMEQSVGAAYDAAPEEKMRATAEADEEYEVELVAADVETVGLAVFSAPGKPSVASDNQPRRVFLLSKSWDAAIHYEAVPELSPHAYLAVKTKNPFAFPILAGRMNLYMENNFVGRAWLKAAQPEEEMTLPFGTDERMKVTRTLLNRKTHEEGVISKTTRIEYRYRITATNQSRNAAATLELVERLPVSSQEKITVKPDDATKKAWTADKEKPGILRADLTLKPGATIELPLVFNVEFPRGKKLVGLP